MVRVSTRQLLPTAERRKYCCVFARWTLSRGAHISKGQDGNSIGLVGRGKKVRSYTVWELSFKHETLDSLCTASLTFSPDSNHISCLKPNSKDSSQVRSPGRWKRASVAQVGVLAMRCRFCDARLRLHQSGACRVCGARLIPADDKISSPNFAPEVATFRRLFHLKRRNPNSIRLRTT